ncbi:MAG: glycosyltransferase family 4 protein [Candidatus Saccharibacteria bacterium]|nr:glycosyltransferase family 4 protein [Candidatus Saccharibacteria bacterium]
MRIGIDARPLQHETRYRGIGKALEFFLAALPSVLSPDDELVFYVDKELPKPDLLNTLSKSRTILVPAPKLGRKRYIRSVLKSFTPIRPSVKDIDVLLQYDANLGVSTRVPTVTMFHDLIPYLFRGQEKKIPAKGVRKAKNSLAGNLYWQKYLRFLKQYAKATHVIAISESSKQDYQKHVRKNPKQPVTVVHLGVTKSHLSGKPSATAKSLAKDPYILYVGGIDLRKNVVGLAKTFYGVKEQHPKLRLLVIGKEFGLKEQLQDLGWFAVLNSNADYKKDVVVPGFLSDADLGYIYAHAEAFVFPSRYEGFGLPVLEAMQAGCPVVAYKNSSVTEISGKAAVLVKDGASMVPAVSQLLTDKNQQKTLIENGRKQVKKFTWEKTALETYRVLKAVAEK